MAHKITSSKESVAKTQAEASAVLKSSQAFLDREKGGGDQGSVLDKIQERLLSATDVVTSQDTGAEALFGEAVAGLEESLEVSQKGIAARFERLRGEEVEQGESQALNALEGRRGFATQTAILRNIKDDTEKDLRQLDLMEQEALAAGRTEIATKLADIKLQKIQFLQQAQQQVFSNLLGLGQLSLGIEQESRLQQQFESQQTGQIRALALEFPDQFTGVNIDELSIDEAYELALPGASEDRRLRLAQQQAQINKLRESADTTGISEGALASAQEILNNPTTSSLVIDADTGTINLEALRQIVGVTDTQEVLRAIKLLQGAGTSAPGVLTMEDSVFLGREYITLGFNLSDALADIDTTNTIANKEQVKEEVESFYEMNLFFQSAGTSKTSTPGIILAKPGGPGFVPEGAKQGANVLFNRGGQ